MRGSVIISVATPSKTRTPLLAAYHLAEGAIGTTSDHCQRLEVSDPDMAAEFAWLSANFQRICELLVEAGVKP